LGAPSREHAPNLKVGLNEIRVCTVADRRLKATNLPQAIFIISMRVRTTHVSLSIFSCFQVGVGDVVESKEHLYSGPMSDA